MDQLLRGTYGQKVGCQGLAADPSSAGIAKAVDEWTLEFRRFQTHKEELAHEFYSEGFARVIPLARQYHERRVAFFVINGWTDAIQICIHNVLEEGGHRLLAARFRSNHLNGPDEIDCVIVPCNKCLRGGY